MYNYKRLLLLLSTLAACLGYASLSQAHCQIPCGIYDDHARVNSLLEDVATIEKAIDQITSLAEKKDPLSQNQLTRWVMNKEKHADNIIDTMGQYFLTQRVSPKQKDYSSRLQQHHAVIVSAMKTKQTVDHSYSKELRENVTALLKYYPEHEH